MNADHRDAWFMSIRYDAALFAVVELASGITVAIIIWQATGLAEVGTLYVFIDWMRRFFLPLRDLSAKYSVMQSSMASAERIFQLLDTQPAVVDRQPSKVVPLRAAEGARGTVEFDHVCFAYQGEDWVLRGHHVPGGAGREGGDRGRHRRRQDHDHQAAHAPLRSDARPGAARRRRSARSAPVRSAPPRGDGAPGRLPVQRDDRGEHRARPSGRWTARASIAWPRAVRADRFIASLPQGYDTQVRERGSNFSAGERQLLSFARALAHGGDVLVLDEATSSIDSETEALIQEGTHALLAGRTAIVIAHRLSTIQDVDRIHVLHKGRIVESGTHEQLLAIGGVYHRLYRLQYEGQERRAGRRLTPRARAGRISGLRRATLGW